MFATTNMNTCYNPFILNNSAKQQIIMKQHLVNLLIEEFTQKCFFDDLAIKGIDLKHICVDNFEIVLDLIGFPKVNTLEYDFQYINSREIRDKSKKLIDDDCFCRDKWTDKYGNVTDKLLKSYKVKLTGMGIQFGLDAYSKKVELKLSGFVDWLYSDLKKLKHNTI
jgi:hypothetical protein